MPHDFGISDHVREWAERNGFDNLEIQLEVFQHRAVAHGYRYADWDAAFMEAIRADWAGVRKQNQGATAHLTFKQRDELEAKRRSDANREAFLNSSKIYDGEVINHA